MKARWEVFGKFLVIAILVLGISLFGSSSNPKRIVAGTVAVTEVLVKLGISPIGVPTTSYELPKEVKNATKIGQPMNPSIEVVKSLQPDLFVSVDSLKPSLEPKLREAKIPYLFVSFSTYDDFYSAVEEIAKAVGRPGGGKVLLNLWKSREKNVLNLISKKSKPKILILFGAPGSIMVATENSYVGSLAKKLGAINVVESSKEAYIPVNVEYLLAQQPDVILRLTHADPETSKKLFDKEFKENSVWKHFKAVSEGKVYDLPNTYFGVSANLYAIDALEKLAELLYNIKIR
ncbi:heme ABC transporter substrate-binding protein IsdE [Fervidobacterium riparium]|nr:hypothetical protein IB67_01215 [Fervidobacterium riparium]